MIRRASAANRSLPRGVWRSVMAGMVGLWRLAAFLSNGVRQVFVVPATVLWRATAVLVVGLWRACVVAFSWLPKSLALVRFWLRRTSAIVDKEMRQLFRERLTLGMIVGLPLIQIILFGYAINMDVRHMPAGLVDHANTSMSRQLASALEATQVLDFVRRSGEAPELLDEMRRGAVRTVLYIPADFERRLGDGTRPVAQLMVDASDPARINAVERIARYLPSPRAQPGQFSMNLAVRNYYNPEQRSAVQIVPALVGVILNFTMIVFTAVAVVREREHGNLEFLITTPVRNYELMLGKIAPYILIGLAQVTIVFFAGTWLFRVPSTGSLLDLYLASLVFVAATLGMGLSISTFARSQFQAIQGSIFFMLPMLLLSGFMFPFDGMPKIAQWIGLLFPLTHFVEVLRGIILRGATLGDMAVRMYAISGLFVVSMLVPILRFTKRLD